MNTAIRRLSVLIAALFGALLVASTVIQFVQAGSMRGMAANKRTLLDNYAQERGSILVAGQPIAKSVEVDDQYRWLRTYPDGRLYSQITGFYAYSVGNPFGLEDAADDLLSGKADRLFVRRVTDLLTGRETAGATIELTIDPKVQQAASDALGKNRGAVVALDPRTGAILAMVSHPQYDPNPLSSHDLDKAASAWKKLSTDRSKPFTNRAISGDLYPPGSTFKVVTAAAALEQGIVDDESSMVPGPAALDLPLTDQPLPNETRQPCGPDDRTTLLHALEISCNTAFGSLGLELGGEQLRAQAAKFGFGDSIQIPMRVSPSTMPAEMNQPQAAQSAIGQYEVRTTPLQMAMIAAGIANQGRVMTPYLIQSVRTADLDVIDGPPDPKELSQAVSTRTADILKRMMVSVVDNGSGRRAQIPGVAVGGKTGTAQHDLEKSPHAWFISFAPADDARVAVAVIVEESGVSGNEVGGAAVAAPIAKAVMEAVIGR
ncbi:peptidoglycan D,D-transpeptidase FtsI family protein [Intrasporangium calvum]|uniref:Cell elongation-specific peptidoglycan D,D-transpeptidase n=1 Tax=Intrasporangium calvum (strain ATCC 23552 / DSM 43043 / JCM 3097 / NBRC 12989 / NCIMB 10167 / NRRL B-3866 / 7 KIP) TaxID=710696 RepID=E6SEM5_INTC7|nr:penicillin-binding protein 2 [Intrasporangium calvum]ADU46626.1 cell elongation-specific peptidoglycan D,D-transpeptidase [Intrasporangium calvum DSM 43043]AXG14997.1 penicillin-binding protein 2 [Intrasporangium calvum]